MSLTGALWSSSSESGRFLVKIMAEDGGEPSLSDTAFIRLSVGNDDNERPAFLGLPYVVDVYEDAEPGTTLLKVCPAITDKQKYC